MSGVERRVADAEGEGGPGRVGVSRAPQRRGKREPLGPLDGIRARPQSGVAVDTPIGFLSIAETRRIPTVVLGFVRMWCNGVIEVGGRGGRGGVEEDCKYGG